MKIASKEFVVNLTTKDLVFATDYCGVVSGRDVDKFALIFGWLGAAFIGSAFFFTLFRTHHAAIRHSSLNDVILKMIIGEGEDEGY